MDLDCLIENCISSFPIFRACRWYCLFPCECAALFAVFYWD